MAKEWAKSFYNSKAWKDCREGYIQLVDGLCERCLSRKEYTPGHIVHHIEWLTPSNIDDPMVTLSHENLEYVCLPCHNTIHFGSNSSVRDDVMFDSEGNLVEI